MENGNTSSAERLTYQQTSLIQELVNCALACESCTTNCLSEHDVTMMARCIQLTRDCADICFLGSTLIMRESEVSDQFLMVCEEICRLCVLPNFVVAIWLILLFSVGLGWLPTGGWGSPAHLILPVIAYSLLPMSLVARYTRVSLLESLGANHVRTARAKGLAERRVLVWHVARNAMIPFVATMIPEIPNILTGSIFIEQISGFPVSVASS